MNVMPSEFPTRIYAIAYPKAGTGDPTRSHPALRTKSGPECALMNRDLL